MSIKDYKAKLNDLKRYNSIQEKDCVLYCMDEDAEAMKAAKILGLNPNNEFEAIAMIFKLREISVSDLIDVNSSCPHCDTINTSNISIPKMFFKDEDNINEDVPVGLFTTLNDLENELFPSEADSFNINNITINEYNELENIVLSNNLKIFDPAVDIVCRKCGSILRTVINYNNIISKFTITNIYEQYLDISYFSNMTKSDTDKMFPFEREIFLGLIQKKEDEKT